MRLVLTREELLEVQEIALKAHKITGVVMIEMGESLDMDTLLMTDRELIDEIINDAIEDIRAIGGSFNGVTGVNGKVSYIIDVPQDFVIFMCRTSVDIMNASTGFIVKSIRFINKYKDVFKKLHCYIAGFISTIAPIFEFNEAKDIQKDFDELEESFVMTKNKINLIVAANEALYALDEYKSKL